MEYLRWILLAAGILFVLVVYMYSRHRAQQRDRGIIHDDIDAAPGFSAVDLDHVDEGVGEVRVVARADDDEASVSPGTRPPEDTEPESGTGDKPAPEIITVYILSESKQDRFGGDSINSAARASGMVFGEMNIFHKLDLDDTPVFSMANMLKPGSFDPDKLFDTETTGLVIFLQLDAVRDADAALSDMLATAYRISEYLGGRLCNHRREAISQQDTDEYRQLAAKY